VPAQSAWAAVEKVTKITASVLPDVYAQAVAAEITVTVQDPDAEYRRPVGN
jgi:hypothetical protein